MRRRIIGFGVLAAVAIAGLILAPSVSAQGFTPIPCAAAPTSKDNPSFQALPGAKAYFGDYEGGMYRFEVPDSWNGELALVMHGTNFGAAMTFGGGARNPFAGTDVLREYFLSNGFAWGASTYRCNGYIPGIGLSDTLLLRELFGKVTGKATPQRTYLLGSSMGGFQTQLAMHVYPTMFDGALAMCGMNSANWDFYVASGAAAEYITGQRFTSGQTVAATQSQMVGVTGLPGSLTAKGLQFASVLINNSGGPRPFAMEGLAPAFNGSPTYQFLMSAGPLAGSDTPGNRTRGNANWKYNVDSGLGITGAELDANVRRISKDESIYQIYEETRPLSGRIERPLLTLYTTADFIVPVINAQALQRAVDGAGRSALLVQRFIRAPGHCGYSGAEQSQAFGDLVKWVRLGQRPEGDEVFGDLSDAGKKFTTPLRPGDPGAIRVPLSPQAAAAPGQVK
jgi:pimeloyl-ACP methyl ester carboxylesterase